MCVEGGGFASSATHIGISSGIFMDFVLRNGEIKLSATRSVVASGSISRWEAGGGGRGEGVGCSENMKHAALLTVHPCLP